MRTNKKGISLIVLVITIVVIIILTGAIVLSISNNNPIQQASSAVQKSDHDAVNSAMTLLIGRAAGDSMGQGLSIKSLAVGSTYASTSPKVAKAEATVTAIAAGTKVAIKSNADVIATATGLPAIQVNTAGDYEVITWENLGMAKPKDADKYTVDASGTVYYDNKKLGEY